MLRAGQFTLIAALLAACAEPEAREPSARPAPAALLEARALVGLDLVAARGFDGTGITVAVIDSGIDRTHPDLAGAVVDEACFCSTGCCPDGNTMQLGTGSAGDDNGHGTHVAGIIASQGTQSPRGAAPGVKLIAIKVLSSTLGFCCAQDLADALDWLVSAHPEVQVVNLSLGTTALYAGDCDVLYSALGLDTLRANGVLVVAASGNDGSSTTMRAPACVSPVLSVGAVWDANVGPQSTYCTETSTAADQVGCFSNASTTLDVLAPGGAVESAWAGGGAQLKVGTSQAAPLVSGCAATLLQADPSLRADSLETLLETTGKQLLDARNGRTYPRIDCGAALAARVPVAPDPDPDPDDGGADPEDDGGTEVVDASAGTSGAADAAVAGAAGGSAAGQGGSGGVGGAGSAGTAGRDAEPVEPGEDAAVGGAGGGGRDAAAAGDAADAAEPGEATEGGDGRRRAGVRVRHGGGGCGVAEGATGTDGVSGMLAMGFVMVMRWRTRRRG